MKRLHRNVKHHHVFIIIFLCVSIIFAGNIIAIDQVYKLVTQSSPAGNESQVILARYDNADDEPVQESPLAPLAEKLTAELLLHDTPISVGVLDLTSGQSIGLNDTTTYQAASFYKLFVVFEVLKQVDDSVLSLNQDVTTEVGPIKLDECIRLTISLSDNDCGRALRKLISADSKPLPELASDGFVGTNLMNDYPITSVSDTMRLFKKLYNGSDLSPKSNNIYLDSLLGQQVNDRLPIGLPGDTKTAHKTADLEGYSHDGGIVYAPFGDFIVVIMSGPWLNGYTDAPPVFKSLVELIYADLSSLASS